MEDTGDSSSNAIGIPKALPATTKLPTHLVEVSRAQALKAQRRHGDASPTQAVDEAKECVVSPLDLVRAVASHEEAAAGAARVAQEALDHREGRVVAPLGLSMNADCQSSN